MVFFFPPFDLFAPALTYYAWNVGGQVKFKGGGKVSGGTFCFALFFQTIGDQQEV